MAEIISKHYKKSRLKNLFRFSLKKIIQMGIFVFIGEYLLLKVISISLSSQGPGSVYEDVSRQIVGLAVSEKPILKVAEAYSHIRKHKDFDTIIQTQYPIQIKGNRPDIRTLDLQDKEGAKVGYVVKF